MADKSPAYQRYPKDYLSDENVALMTLEQEGAYNRLMDYCWLQRSIPADLASLAALCRVPAEAMERIWPGVEKCFRRQGERYVHPRLDLERRKQEARRKAKSEAGKAGAKAKWENAENGTANILPMANDSFAVCSLQSASAIASPEVAQSPPLRSKAQPAGEHADLHAWMADYAACLSALDGYTQRAVWGLWGPHGVQAHDWRGIEPPRQQAILATVVLTYAAEGKRGFHRPFFAKILTRAVDDAIASDRQADQRDTETTQANETRERARQLEQAEIARLNAAAAKAGQVAIPNTPRGTGLNPIRVLAETQK